MSRPDVSDVFGQRVSLRPITTDRDGVLYPYERRASQTRRRRVAPESCEGRTPHLVVAWKSSECTFDDTMFTDFELVADGKLKEGFRYWRADGKVKMGTPLEVGHELASYMQVVTMNSWWCMVGRALGFVAMTSVSKYASATFITTISYHPSSYDGYLSYFVALFLPVVFIGNFACQLYYSYESMSEYWYTHTERTGDIVLKDCTDEALGQTGEDGCTLSRSEIAYTKLCLFIMEYFMIARTLRIAPSVFHPWKGSGDFAAIKAEGARMYLLGHTSEYYFKLNEIGFGFSEGKRRYIQFVSDLVLAVLKMYLSTITKSSFMFAAITILLPLTFTLYSAWSLFHSRAHYREILEKTILAMNPDDPFTRNAENEYYMHFPAPWVPWERDPLVVPGEGFAVGGQKYAARMQSRLSQLQADLRLLENKLNVEHLADLLTPLIARSSFCAQEPRMDEKVAEAVQRLRGGVLKDTICICILGGTTFKGKDSEELVKDLAKKLVEKTRDSPVAFVTGGMAGVQSVFAESCGDGSKLWNLLPIGGSSGYGKGTDVHAGADLEVRKAVFGQLGDIYITIEGGPGVAQEATAASERGAKIVPLIRTGGASSGMFDFPAVALQRPRTVREDVWKSLVSQEVPVSKSAADAAAIVAAMVEQALQYRAGGYVEESRDSALPGDRDIVPEESAARSCRICHKWLSRLLLNPRRHCKSCGNTVCETCSQLHCGLGIHQRVCKDCAGPSRGREQHM